MTRQGGFRNGGKAVCIVALFCSCYVLELSQAAPSANHLTRDNDNPSRGDPLTKEEFHAKPEHPDLDDEEIANKIRKAMEGEHKEGDMLYPNHVLESGAFNLQNAIINVNQKWPNATVPYEISAAFDSNERVIIANAMNAYHTNTCIRFVSHTTQNDYISIEKGSGCNSYIGRIGGKQVLNLGIGCVYYLRQPEHELMHAVGFYHEQSRPDRDNYVNILWDKIQSQYKSNFDVAINSQYLGTFYDYGSVMHYPPSSFPIVAGDITITKKDGTTNGIGGAVLSQNDFLKINRLYACPGTDMCWDEDLVNCGVVKCNQTIELQKCRKTCKQCDATVNTTPIASTTTTTKATTTTTPTTTTTTTKATTTTTPTTTTTTTKATTTTTPTTTTTTTKATTTPTTTTTTTKATTTTTPTTTTATTKATTTTKPTCVDLIPFCSLLNTFGYCTNVITKNYLSFLCPLSCKVC